MPAPLARGILLSLSLLIAAGIAVYENPQIREWIEENRRKLALALHGLGDEMHPSSSWGRDDVSLREDNSPEAVERRRRARQAILDRAREMHASRGLPLPTHRRGQSFDDLVDDEGNLRDSSGETMATTTGTSMYDGSSSAHLRNRATEAAGAAAGTVAANPFADEMVISYNSGLSEEDALERATRESESESVASLARSASERELETLVERELQKMDRLRLQVDTRLSSDHAADGTAATSKDNEPEHDEDTRSESEVLVELTPTTSRAPSSFHPNMLTPRTPRTPSAATDMGREVERGLSRTPLTPRSTASAAFVEPPDLTLAEPPETASVSALSAADFQSIHDWAASSSAGFYSPPPSVSGASVSEAASVSLEASLARNRDVGGANDQEGERECEPLEEAEWLSAADDVISRADTDTDAGTDTELVSKADALSSRASAAPSTTGGQWSEIGSVVSDEEH